MMAKRTTFDDFRKQALKKPAVKAAYDELAPAYAMKRDMIAMRKAKGLTQEDMANLLGTRKSNISRLESVNSAISPRIATVAEYARVLGYRMKVEFETESTRSQPENPTYARTSRLRDEYLKLRHRYEPEAIQLIIIAESPPASGRYFYDPTDRCTEPLFAEMMKELGFSPSTKENGLRKFQQRGWVLLDATYEPVNELGDRERNNVIARDYPLLRKDLDTLVSHKTTPIILIKANVCRILAPKLVADGFNVINRDRAVYFPAAGRQPDFHRQFKASLKAARIPQGASTTLD